MRHQASGRRRRAGEACHGVTSDARRFRTGDLADRTANIPISLQLEQVEGVEAAVVLGRFNHDVRMYSPVGLMGTRRGWCKYVDGREEERGPCMRC